MIINQFQFENLSKRKKRKRKKDEKVSKTKSSKSIHIPNQRRISQLSFIFSANGTKIASFHDRTIKKNTFFY